MTRIAGAARPVSIVLPLLALLTGSALGQAPPDSLHPYQLPEMVVTGTRTPQPLDKVPASVTLVTRGQFADGRGLSLKDALLNVPGVLVQSRAGGQDVRLTIRGFGARGNGERSNSGVIRGIRILTEGIPVSEPDGRTSLDLADLGAVDQVEISRSNASALYGNASGGVIDLRSDLNFDAPYARLRARGGSFGYLRGQAQMGLVVNRSRAILALGNSTSEGWRAHSQSQTALFQARLNTPLDDDTKLGLMLDAVRNQNRFPGPLTRAELDSAPEMANPRFVERDERRENWIGRLALRLDHAWNRDRDLNVAFWVEPKKLERSERGRFRDFNRVHTGLTAALLERFELSPEWSGEFSAGADEAWQDGSILFYDITPDGGRGTDLKANKREAANSAGGYAQTELTWRKRWSVRLAGRYDNVWYRSQDFVEPALDADKTFERITPKASLAWLGDGQTIFATLGGGVEAPAFNEVDPPAPFDTLTSLNPFLETTHSTTWEVGARGRLGRAEELHYELSLYWIDVINDFVPFDGGAYFYTVGRTRRQGAEIGLEWSPLERLRLGTTGTLSRNRYREYEVDGVDYAGNRVAGLPDVVVRGTARYQFLNGLSVEAAADWVGSSFADDANRARAPASLLFGGRAAWTRLVDARPVRAFVGVENLTDRRHVSSVYINGVGGEYYEPGLPRHWTAGLTVGL